MQNHPHPAREKLREKGASIVLLSIGGVLVAMVITLVYLNSKAAVLLLAGTRTEGTIVKTETTVETLGWSAVFVERPVVEYRVGGEVYSITGSTNVSTDDVGKAESVLYLDKLPGCAMRYRSDELLKHMWPVLAIATVVFTLVCLRIRYGIASAAARARRNHGLQS
jgi:hypothetical protein